MVGTWLGTPFLGWLLVGWELGDGGQGKLSSSCSIGTNPSFPPPGMIGKTNPPRLHKFDYRSLLQTSTGDSCGAPRILQPGKMLFIF